jgi:hypothetical protein
MNAVLVITFLFTLGGVPFSQTQYVPWTDKAACEAWKAAPDQVGISIVGPLPSQIQRHGVACLTKDELRELEEALQPAEPPMGPPAPKASPTGARNA